MKVRITFDISESARKGMQLSQGSFVTDTTPPREVSPADYQTVRACILDAIDEMRHDYAMDYEDVRE